MRGGVRWFRGRGEWRVLRPSRIDRNAGGRPPLVGRNVKMRSHFFHPRFVAGILFGVVLCAGGVHGQAAAPTTPEDREDASATTRKIPLWDGEVPGALGDADEDKPTITIYQPSEEHDAAPAVIVIPGG